MDTAGEHTSPHTRLFVLLQDHTARADNELTLAQGERVLAEYIIPNGWWYCKALDGDVHGWLPSTRLGMVAKTGFAKPASDTLQLTKEQSMLTARASATSDFVIQEEEFIADLEYAERQQRQLFRSLEWVSDTDATAFLQPLQSVLHVEKEIARQLQSHTLDHASDSCSVTAVLLSNALELLHVYTSTAAECPTMVNRFRALADSASEFNATLSTEEQSLLPKALRAILNHVQTSQDAYDFLRMCTPQSHPDAARVKRCTAFLMHLTQAVDSVEYLKTAEEALRRASINAWQGPALDKCGQLLLTSKVKVSKRGIEARGGNEVHLLLLFEQRIILVVVDAPATEQRKGRQYRLVRSMPMEHEGAPTLCQQSGRHCLLRGARGWDRTALHLQFPSAQDAALWEQLVATWRTKICNSGDEDPPSWPASFGSTPVDRQQLEGARQEMSAKAADEDAQQEYAIVSAYLGTKHKARPLGKH